MTKTAAQALYDELNTAGDVQAMIDRNESERLHLDFKSWEPNRDERRKSLGKYLSGFANADGGILVFGVREDKKAKTLRPAPIEDARAFAEEVLGLISIVTSRPVPHVEAKALLLDQNERAGYVIVLVPQSVEAPHQAVAKNVYYFRAGESFKPMEHYQVADLFGKRLRPVLVPYGRIALVEREHDRVMEMVVGIRNVGKGIARFPALQFEQTSPFNFATYELDGEGQAGIARIQKLPDGRVYRGGADDVVHAGAELDVTRLQASPGKAYGLASDRHVVARLIIQADGMEPRRFEIAPTIGELNWHRISPGSAKTYDAIEVDD